MLGADKYGAYNWRKDKIAVMEYCSAMIRHIQKFVDGEDYEDGAHHLGNVIAGAAIVLDALELDHVIDDRPAKGPAAELLKRLSEGANEAPKDNPYLCNVPSSDELQRRVQQQPLQHPSANGRTVG